MRMFIAWTHGRTRDRFLIARACVRSSGESAPRSSRIGWKRAHPLATRVSGYHVWANGTPAGCLYTLFMTIIPGHRGAIHFHLIFDDLRVLRALGDDLHCQPVDIHRELSNIHWILVHQRSKYVVSLLLRNLTGRLLGFIMDQPELSRYNRYARRGYLCGAMSCKFYAICKLSL